MADLYARLFREVLYPLYEERLRGRPTLQHLEVLQKTQWRPWEELRAQAEADLRRLLAHAYAHVPHYRRAFDEAGVRPDDVRAVEDLPRLPMLTRDRARETTEERASMAQPRADIRKSTGGTTGQPLTFGYDAGSEYWRQAVKLRGYGWAGYKLGDRTLHYWGAPIHPLPPPPTRAKRWVDRRVKRERYFDCTLRSEADMVRVCEELAREPPDALLCYTQAGADLARFILDRDLRRWDTIPVLCCAEGLFAADREKLEAAFGPAVFETYGCREVMLIGSECEAHDGLHLSAENLIVEVVVRDGGRERPAEPGEAGEVVITDLHNFGMPFIRYANGDVAVQGPRERCRCGRSLPRIASVDGRSADTLRDARGNRVGGLVFNIIFAVVAQTVRQFQAVQHKDGAITLKLIPTEKFNGETRALVMKNLEKYLPGTPVTIQMVEEIPPSKSGKRQVVVVEKG